MLEDIDVAGTPREAFTNSDFKAYEGLTRVTMSGLLNAIGLIQIIYYCLTNLKIKKGYKRECLKQCINCNSNVFAINLLLFFNRD